MEFRYKVAPEVKIIDDSEFTFTFKVLTYIKDEYVKTPFFKLIIHDSGIKNWENQYSGNEYILGSIKFVETTKDDFRKDYSPENYEYLDDVLDRDKIHFTIEEFYSYPGIFRELLNDYEKEFFKNFGTNMFEYAIEFLKAYFPKNSNFFLGDKLKFRKEKRTLNLGYIVALIEKTYYTEDLRRKYPGVPLNIFESNLSLAENFFVKKLNFDIIDKDNTYEIMCIL